MICILFEFSVSFTNFGLATFGVCLLLKDIVLLLVGHLLCNGCSIMLLGIDKLPLGFGGVPSHRIHREFKLLELYGWWSILFHCELIEIVICQQNAAFLKELFYFGHFLFEIGFDVV